MDDRVTRQISALVREVADRCVADRRAVHRHAELGWCELHTTALIVRRLREIGVDSLSWGKELYSGVKRMGVPPADVLTDAAQRAATLGVTADELAMMVDGQTGAVATIEGGRPGPTVALRCDIDGLPIEESAADDHVPLREGFRSETPGVMHSCGHDGHVAIGLAVAEVLTRLREQLHGRIKLIFQPAEEGTRGADALVQAGWLDDVERFLGFHISGTAGLRTGSVTPGVYDMLATVKVDADFKGQAAHFALAPDQGRNALVVASAVSLLAHAIPRKPGTRSLINIGRLEAGTARNIVPAEAKLLMEVRAERNEYADALLTQLEGLIQGLSQAFGVSSELTRVGYSPAASSDQAIVELVQRVGASMPDLEVREQIAFAASDDAAAMMCHVQRRGGQAAYIRVGADLAGINHSPAFDFDERALPIGVEVLTRTLLALGSAEPS